MMSFLKNRSISMSMLFVIGAKWNLRMRGCSRDCERSICSHYTKSVTCWEPSNEGWLKFNDDGSTLGKFGSTGCGVDIRNSKGHVFAMFRPMVDSGSIVELT
ncbi:hypothetical protein Gotur_029205 [Gossypium turneri]